jgi:predicted dehydrogenase
MTLRIGILGAARVATYALITPAAEISGVTVAGVAARDKARAQKYAADHGIAKTYDDYDALINAADIDAIYNALPPSLHAPWSIAALEAGKPVLCEKPFALSTADVRVMLAAEEKSGLLLMEAQHSRYHPLLQRAIDVVHAGIIGDIRHIDATFNAPISLPTGEIRTLPDIGGGALWDLGTYPAYWIRAVSGMEPMVVSAAQQLQATGADLATIANLSLPNGGTATLTCHMDSALEVMLAIKGSKGSLTVRNPLAPQRGHDFTLVIGDTTTTETFPLTPTYTYQLEAFRNAILEKTPVPTRGADSLATITLLENIQRTARATA